MSKSKLLYETKFLSLYESEKGFYYGQRKNVDSVAVLCFKKENGQYHFLLRYQPLPEIKTKISWDELYPSPITGSCEENEDYLTTAIRETYEEGGIQIEPKHLVCSNQNVATTQMNEIVYNYVFDVTGLKQNEALGDGSIFESASKNVWVTQKELEEIIFNNKEKSYLSSLAVCYLLFLKNK